MPAKPVRLSKQETIDRWSSIPDGPISVTPIEYKHKGSSYDQDSIRITGSQEFIDSILARLSPLLEYDSGPTRLHVMYTQTVDRRSGELSGSWGCYVQVHARGTGRFRGSVRKSRKAPSMLATRPAENGPPDPPTPASQSTTGHVGGQVDPPADSTFRGLEATLNAPLAPRRKATTRYALAYVYDDGHEWAEPNGGVGCDTYDSEEDAMDSYRAFERTPGTRMDNLQVVKVRISGKDRGRAELVKA